MCGFRLSAFAEGFGGPAVAFSGGWVAGRQREACTVGPPAASFRLKAEATPRLYAQALKPEATGYDFSNLGLVLTRVVNVMNVCGPGVNLGETPQRIL